MNGRCTQRGAVLFIALIALVALALIALRQFRAIDVTSLLSGNVAFRQSSTQAAERGIQLAAAWLFDPANKARLAAPLPAERYYASTPTAEPDWKSDAVWGSSPAIDEPGQRIDYVIHRLCRVDGPVDSPNECIEGSPTSASDGSTHRVGGNVSYSKPQIQYRVTVRVRGPRGTVAIVQSMLLGPRT